MATAARYDYLHVFSLADLEFNVVDDVVSIVCTATGEVLHIASGIEGDVASSMFIALREAVAEGVVVRGGKMCALGFLNPQTGLVEVGSASRSGGRKVFLWSNDVPSEGVTVTLADLGEPISAVDAARIAAPHLLAG